MPTTHKGGTSEMEMATPGSESATSERLMAKAPAAPAHEAEAAGAAEHEHGEGWSPQDGFERTAFTFVANIIKGGKVVEAGARAVATGGYYTLPKLAVDGGMFIGATLAGMLADRVGRKAMFQATLLLYSIFTGLSAFAFSAGVGAAYLMQLRSQYRSWGLVPGGNERGVRCA